MKNALITGASRGLGLALAHQLARNGLGIDHRCTGVKSLEQVQLKLSASTKVIAIPGDVTTKSHREKLAKAASQLGGIDTLVNNASTLGPSPQPALLDYPLDVLEKVYLANVITPLAVIQSLRAALRPEACVLNVTSDAGVEAYEGWGGYGSSKAALEHLSRHSSQGESCAANLLGRSG